MAAPLPYVRQRYDNRQHVGRMSDLIGEQGRIAADAAYRGGMANAALVGNLANTAANTLSQYGQFKYAQQQQQKLENKEQARKDALRMAYSAREGGELRSPEKIAADIRAAGYPEDADKYELHAAQIESAKMQRQLAQYDLNDRQIEQGLRQLQTIRGLPKEQRDAKWLEFKNNYAAKVAPPELVGMFPDTYDENFVKTLDTWALSGKERLDYARQATLDAQNARDKKASTITAMLPSMAKMASGVKTPEELRAVYAIADEISEGTGAIFQRLMPTPERARALAGGDAKTPDIARLNAFAQSKGVADYTQMKNEHWEEWKKAEDAAEIAKRRASLAPEKQERFTFENQQSAEQMLITGRNNALKTRNEAVASGVDAATADAEYRAETDRLQTAYERIMQSGGAGPGSMINLIPGGFGIGNQQMGGFGRKPAPGQSINFFGGSPPVQAPPRPPQAPINWGAMAQEFGATVVSPTNRR